MAIIFECIDCGAPCPSVAVYYCGFCAEKRARNAELRAYAMSLGRAGWRDALERGAIARGSDFVYVGGAL